MRTSVTRTVEFTATHRYWKPEWSEAENQRRFGRITRSHPHDYRCSVTVTGPLEKETGMVMDLAVLDRLLEEQVISRLANKALDREVPEFAEGRALPSCEAIAQDVFSRLVTRLPAGVLLQEVRVAESDGLAATVTGDP